ncbi:MAG: hypothetical protein CMJ46_16600 [Planctomyces sp.]|nr:hypothetical protein [Planctomyces sp.]
MHPFLFACGMGDWSQVISNVVFCSLYHVALGGSLLLGISVVCSQVVNMIETHLEHTYSPRGE